jgi:glycosyltransferase involved in cell wall biosynthesis
VTPLTAIIPCFNEEAVIEPCLASVQFADEILVVDSFSTDRTLEIARKYATRVLQHEYENSAAQKNWAIPQAKHDWVLIVDSDERVPADLATEIQKLLKTPTFDGYWIRRRNFFLGREIRHGTWKTDKVLRLFRRDKASYQPKHVHAEIELQGEAGWCGGQLDHYSYRTLDDFLRKAGRYSTWGALNARDQGKSASGARILGHSMAHFFKSYVAKQGFRDGTPGLIIAFMESFHSFLKYAKLWEITHTQRENAPARME